MKHLKTGMRHIAHRHELCNTYECHVTHMNAYEWVMPHKNSWLYTMEPLETLYRLARNESRLTYEIVMSHMCMSHVVHVHESCRILNEACHTYTVGGTQWSCSKRCTDSPETKKHAKLRSRYKFSNDSLPMNVLYKITTELIFEKFHRRSKLVCTNCSVDGIFQNSVLSSLYPPAYMNHEKIAKDWSPLDTPWELVPDRYVPVLNISTRPFWSDGNEKANWVEWQN